MEADAAEASDADLDEVLVEPVIAAEDDIEAVELRPDPAGLEGPDASMPSEDVMQVRRVPRRRSGRRGVTVAAGQAQKPASPESESGGHSELGDSSGESGPASPPS